MDQSMKRRFISFSFFLVMLMGALSACAAGELPMYSDVPTATATPTPSPLLEIIETPNPSPLPGPTETLSPNLLHEPINTPAPAEEKITETILTFQIPFAFGEKPEREKLRDIVRADFDNETQKDSFVRNYLAERGMDKSAPDGIYGYGRYRAEYYFNEEQEKYSFILHENMSKDKYYELIHCITFFDDD